VYESCEALFCALADETQKYTDWLALGDTGEDLEELVEQQLWGSSAARAADGDDLDSSSTGPGVVTSGQQDDKGMAAWELNMKALKTAAYDLGRLPTEVSCDGSSSSSRSGKHSRNVTITPSQGGYADNTSNLVGGCEGSSAGSSGSKRACCRTCALRASHMYLVMLAKHIVLPTGCCAGPHRCVLCAAECIQGLHGGNGQAPQGGTGCKPQETSEHACTWYTSVMPASDVCPWHPDVSCLDIPCCKCLFVSTGLHTP
jgi:hypothetical protein